MTNSRWPVHGRCPGDFRDSQAVGIPGYHLVSSRRGKCECAYPRATTERRGRLAPKTRDEPMGGYSPKMPMAALRPKTRGQAESHVKFSRLRGPGYQLSLMGGTRGSPLLRSRFSRRVGGATPARKNKSGAVSFESQLAAAGGRHRKNAKKRKRSRPFARPTD